MEPVTLSNENSNSYSELYNARYDYFTIKSIKYKKNHLWPIWIKKIKQQDTTLNIILVKPKI